MRKNDVVNGATTTAASSSAANIQGSLHLPAYLNGGGLGQYPRKRKKKRDENVGKSLPDTIVEKDMPLGPKADASDYIHDFVHSGNARFKGKSKEERIRMALGAYYGKAYEDALDTELAKIGARHSKSDKEMIQTMHDHSVSLGADCPMHKVQSDGAEEDYNVEIVKVDKTLGLVMGYAIICKVDGEPYYDLNVDPSGTRVPEHIPEDAMLKAACDFMMNSRMGNEMHEGPDAGTYVFAFPLTTEIAKAMGIDARTTGLLVAYKPPPEVLAKFVDGTYKGFSIEGKRLAIEEHE